MTRLYLVADGREVTRRRSLLPAGSFVEAWPDLYLEGSVWLGPEAKALVDGPADPVAVALAVDGSGVSIYYGPRLSDLGSLPAEDSLRARVLSAHGIAAAWVTLDQFGAPTGYQPQSPLDPVFVLRRPGGTVAHRWRLFRTREEAVTFMREFYGNDPEARAWAEGLPVEHYEALLARYAGPAAGG